MRKLFENLLRLAQPVLGAFDSRDVCTFGGLLLLGYGLAAVYSPAGWIVVGAGLFWIGVRR